MGLFQRCVKKREMSPESSLGVCGIGIFTDEYFHQTEPVAEYEDRVALYELYHHLNHHALFGGGYRSGAMSIMRNLVSKYGEKSEL